MARALDWLGLPLAALALSQLSERQRRIVFGIWSGVLVVSCVVAGLQSFGLWPRPEAMGWLSDTKVPFGRVYESVGGTDRFMGGGLLFHRLKFAHVTSLGVLAAFAAGFGTRGRGRIALWLLAAWGLVAVAAFPFARAALVALVCGLGVASLRRLRLSQLAVGGLATVTLLGALFFSMPSVRARFTSGDDGERAYHRAAGIRAFQSSPWVGIGAGQFRPSKFAEPTMPEHVRENPGKAHNQFLSIAAETGLLGLLLFLALLGWLAATFWNAGSAGSAGLGILAFFVVLSLVHDPLFQAPFSMALALALGLSRFLVRGPQR